ncbi:MAG: carboxypeptidase regulatory-like domain-containing protein [Fibrobacteres bacterium]|nr:carboxypeptidase regulatory-like domain-containing protein [Fibrobacterota bacterium]
MDRGHQFPGKLFPRVAPISAALSSSSPSRTTDFALAANPYTLSGAVRNSFTRQGIFGATVQLVQGGQTRTANTDGNGAFSFSVPGGAASVRAYCAGFAAPEPVSLSVDGDKTLAFALDPNASILSGRTRDLSGTGIPGAMVIATPKAGTVRTALSDNQGYFELSLPAGDWILAGSAKGYASQTTRNFLLDVSKTVQGVDFSFAPNGSLINGRVTINGGGLAGALVVSGQASAATDNSGYYRLSVNTGTQSVSAAKEGYLIPKIWTLPINPGDSVANIDFAASGNAGTVKGHVLSGGAGVAGATVKAANKATRETFSQVSDGTGAYALSLPGADYELSAAKDGFALDALLVFSLPAGGTILDQNLKLVANQGIVSGTVASGSAVLSNCEVAYRGATDASSAGKTLTDPQGRYSLSLPAGAAYLLTTTCTGYQQGTATVAALTRGSAATQDFNVPAAGATFKGKVVDGAGKALSAAKATAAKDGASVSTASDFNGAYAFGLGAGAYGLTVSKAGYRTVNRSLSLSLGDNSGAADTLRPSVGRLAGRVTSDGAPVAGALLSLAGFSADAGGGLFATDADGHYSGDNLAAGSYSLSVSADGYADAKLASLTISDGQLTNADLVLTANRSALEGTVQADGVAAANAVVAATAYGVARSAVSGPDGKYRIDKLPAGTYSLSATLAGYAADKTYDGKGLTAGATLSGLDFALSRNVGSLAGTVSGAANSSGIQVTAVGVKKGARSYAVCDAAGKYSIPSLPADDYTLTVAAPGYKIASGTQSPVATVAGALRFDIALAPAVFRLAGVLVDQANTGIGGMPMELRAGSSTVRITTQSDGSYAFADVPAGQEYQLSCKPPTAGFDPKDTAFSLSLDAPATVIANLSTLSRQASLSGSVSLDGVAAEGALIRVNGSGNALTSLSQPGGFFKVSGIAGSAQPLSVSVSKSGAGGFDTSLIVNVGGSVAGLAIKLKTLKLSLAAILSSSEGKPLAGAKVVAASAKRLDTLVTGTDGKITVKDIPANQALTLATALDKDLYDNLEASVFLKEADTSIALQAKVHAASVTVSVKDRAGDPVDGADVQMNGQALGKTTQGRLVAAKLARGSYVFIAGKSGYKSGPAQSLSLPGDTSASVDLILTKVTGGVYGTVRDTGLDQAGPGGLAVATARSLPGAIVIMVAGTDTLRDTVNDLGQYSLDGLTEGRQYQINLALPGYRPLLDSIVGNVQPQARDLILRPFPGSVLGRVLGGKSGVKMVLSHRAGGGTETFLARYGGYYAFTGLQNRNDYVVQALDGTNGSPAVAFQADGALAKRFDPVLDAWGSVQGAVTGFSGNAVAGALLSARNTVTGALTLATSDAAGKYVLAGLGTGAYELTADRTGYRSPKASTANVTKGAQASADFRLEETVDGIGGLVADAAGRGVAATVILVAGKDTSKQETDGSGQFAFGGLVAGSYSLTARKDGYASPAPVTIAYGGKGLESRALALQRQDHLINGLVRDALTNTPLAGAQIGVAGGASAISDSLGHYQVASPSGVPLVSLAASLDGYLPRSGLPVYVDSNGSATQDIVLSADYRFDGRINVTVKEGKDPVPGLLISLQSFHPDDSLAFSISAAVASSFRDLRRPVPYTLKVKRDGYKDLVKGVELTAKSPTLDVTLAYPTSRIRVFMTGDGKHGKSVELSLNGQSLPEHPDTAGLYLSGAKLKPDRYEVAVRDRETDLIPLAPYFIGLGEDSVRTDTLSQPFFAVAIPDSTIDSPFLARVRRVDSLRPAPAVTCSLYYRSQGEPLWKSLAMDSTAGGFADTVPAQSRAGVYEYYFALRSPSGARVGVLSGGNASVAGLPTSYSGVQSPKTFSLRDPYLLQSFALLPQRLEADTSVYSLDARDLFQAQMRGEKGVSLDAYFDRKAAAGESDYTVSWSFSEPDRAKAAGLVLDPVSGNPRMIRFSGGHKPSDSVYRIESAVRMGDVRLKKSFYVKIQDLTPASVGIRYVKENRVLEENGATLPLDNRNAAGYAFAAFAKTADGRIFNILPRWSLGEDSAAGRITQQGVFFPDSAVARSAVMSIFDTLRVGATRTGEALYAAFQADADLMTLAQVAPASKGSTVVTNGEGAVLEFNLAGLSKAFTVSVTKPKVSGLLRSSPKEEVVGQILDIDLSERQPFKADSGAVLKLPVANGIARRRTTYLGHWNSGLLAWEKVDSASAGADVSGKVYSFSKYAVLMGSLPLGAYDITLAPNPFSADDPWGLQLGYKVSSDVSSQVGVRVEVYNMMGDKVYESEETQLGKGDLVTPGTKKAAPKSPERRAALGPFVWDGRDTRGDPCRNGRYLFKLIVKDGKGSKEYLRKVVMLK